MEYCWLKSIIYIRQINFNLQFLKKDKKYVKPRLKLIHVGGNGRKLIWIWLKSSQFLQLLHEKRSSRTAKSTGSIANARGG